MKITVRHMIPLALLLALLVTGCGGQGAATDPGTATLGELSGTVEIRNAGQEGFEVAAEGMTLGVGGQVRTGEDGRLRLDLSSGSIIRMAPNTSFTLTAGEQTEAGLFTTLQLTAGRIWTILTGGGINVDTNSGTAGVRGSHLMVWIDPGNGDVWISCFEGECSAENSSGVSLDLATGQGTILYAVPAGGTPPAPLAYNLSRDEYQLWNESVPEAEALIPAIVPTLTALPTPTPLPTATSTPTPTATPTPLPTPTPAPTIVGTWEGTYSVPIVGVTLHLTLTFGSDGSFTQTVDGETIGGSYAANFSGSVGSLDIYGGDGTILTIVELVDYNTLRMDNNPVGAGRPAVFSDPILLHRVSP